MCYLKELELRLLGEHLGVVGVKLGQLPLNVRQGTFLHDTLGDVLVRAKVVPPIHLNTTPDNLLTHLRINSNYNLGDDVGSIERQNQILNGKYHIPISNCITTQHMAIIYIFIDLTQQDFKMLHVVLNLATVIGKWK